MDTSTASAKEADEGKSAEQAIEAAEVAKPAQDVKSITKGTLKTNSIHQHQFLQLFYLRYLISNFYTFTRI